MSTHLFKFWAMNMATKQATQFLGQGETLDEAWKDAIKNLNAPFRPKQDGRVHPPIPLTVTLQDGSKITRSLQEFERDETKP